MIEGIDSTKSLPTIFLLDAIKMFFLACDNVTECLKKVWFSDIEDDNAVSDDPFVAWNLKLEIGTWNKRLCKKKKNRWQTSFLVNYPLFRFYLLLSFIENIIVNVIENLFIFICY